MTLNRIAVAAGIALLTAFLIAIVIAGPVGLRTVTIVLVTLVALVGAGNLLYGRRSHYAAAQARTRPAQEAHDHAAAVAADVRRATAEAARRGERYCPLDPGHRETQATQPTHARPSAGTGAGGATQAAGTGATDGHP